MQWRLQSTSNSHCHWYLTPSTLGIPIGKQVAALSLCLASDPLFLCLARQAYLMPNLHLANTSNSQVVSHPPFQQTEPAVISFLV